MNSLADAREALAAAVTGAGLHCLPYPPDNPSPPIGWVDQLGIDYGTATTFNLAPVIATVVTCGLRNDRTNTTTALEALVGTTVAALRALPGVQVASVQSGETEIGKTELPAVIYTVRFQLDDSTTDQPRGAL